MADREHKGLVARWLEGKERDDEYARSTLPTNRWQLFWDIMKGRFGRLMLINLLTLVTFIPLILVYIWRLLVNSAQDMLGPYGSGLGVGYPVIPNVVGVAEWTAFQNDLLFFALFIVAGFIAALGLSGGMYIIRNLIWTEGIFVANDFVRGIRRNFWNVLEAVFLFTLPLFVAQTMGNLANWCIAMDIAPGWMIVSKVVGYVLVALMGLISLWMISLGINYKQGPWALFRNAVVMTIGTFPQTVFFAVLALLPIGLLFTGVNFIVVIAVVVMLLFGFSYAMLVWMDYSQWAFDKFINPNLGVKTGRGLYSRTPQEDKIGGSASATQGETSEAVREYRRMILAQGKSKLVSRPIKPLDDDLEVYQLPESFSREDLQRLRESKEAIDEDAKAYEKEHENDEQYVEYNKQFEEMERALEGEDDKKKKGKLKKAPKMLNKR